MCVLPAALRLDVTAVDHERAGRTFVSDAEHVRVSRYRLGTDAV
jgi:hypothetical protein